MMARNKPNEDKSNEDDMMPAVPIIIGCIGFVLVGASGELTTTRAGELVLGGIGLLITIIAIVFLPIYWFFFKYKRNRPKE